MNDPKKIEIKSATDRELLVELVIRQEYQTNAMNIMKQQIDNVEKKLIDDLDKRIRDLENAKIAGDSKETVKYDYWPNFIKFITVVSGIIAVLITLKSLIIR